MILRRWFISNWGHLKQKAHSSQKLAVMWTDAAGPKQIKKLLLQQNQLYFSHTFSNISLFWNLQNTIQCPTEPEHPISWPWTSHSLSTWPNSLCCSEEKVRRRTINCTALISSEERRSTTMDKLIIVMFLKKVKDNSTSRETLHQETLSQLP